MQCDYVEVSVLENKGIETLIDKVIEKCLMLQAVIDKDMIKDGMGESFKISTEGSDIAKIKPVKVRRRKSKKSDCCA
jgi:hypothetical protein